MSMTIGCPIPGASQPKEPARLIDANDVMQNVLDEIRYKESLYTSTVRLITKKAIDAAPTIDPESLRPTAHWISDSGGSTNVVCSACNAISFAAYNFCPECGKRMVNADEKHCT